MLKRFMAWLLHRLQSVLGALAGRRSNSPTSESTQIGEKIASRLQSSRQDPDGDAPIAVRTKSAQLGTVLLDRSTSTLRSNNYSAPESPDDLGADEFDTHQRLDAAPASLSGDTLAAPGFPTDVSELISSRPSQRPVLKNDEPDSLPAPNIEPPIEAVDLPDIHDLLPAIESDEAEDISFDAQPVVDETAIASAKPVPETVDIAKSAIEPNAPIVESAQRVFVDDQATLFSFDIVEADTSVEASLLEIPSVEIPSVEIPQAQTPSSDALTAHKASEEADIQAGEAAEPLAVEPSVEALAASPETIVEPVETEPVVTESEEIEELPPTPVQNPWLMAVPSAQKNTEEVPTELLTKNGVVKLLFKLKQGNFHGYITPEDGSKDILFHQKYINADIFDELDRGTPVVVTVKYLEGKAYATQVDLL